MTVTTTLDRQEFNGDGANKVFPFNFRFFTNDQIKVSIISPDGFVVPQAETTHYTLSGANLSGGGVVTMIIAPPLTVPPTKVLVQRVLAPVQPISIRNQGSFFPQIHEDAFDRLTMLIQQALAGVDNSDQELLRTVRGAPREILAELPSASTRANKIMGFDSLGNPVGVLPGSGTAIELALDLANSSDPNLGSAMVARSSVVVESVRNLLLAKKDTTQTVRTLSWYSGLEKGGLTYSWSPTTPKSRHNGGTILSPTVPYDEGAGLNDFLNGTYESQPEGSGCWVADIYGQDVTTLHFGAKADGVLGDGMAGTDDGFAINAALKAAGAQGIGRIRQAGISRHRQTILVPSYVTYTGTPADGIQVAQNWIGTGARKSITNADTVNGNTACGVERINVRGLPTGSEWDHGIHFCKTVSAVIIRPNIADVAGDAICIGNITGGVNGLCVDTQIDAPVIRRAGRMGIAMTNARGTQGRNVDIADLTGAILNGGVGIDWEPDSAGDECTDNVFIGGAIRNVKEGATMASVASLTDALSKGNAIIGVTIDTTQGDGIRATYSSTQVSGNTLSNIGKNGIYVTSGSGVQGSTITGNRVLSCSKALAQTYDAYRLGGTAHCVFSGNISRATDARWSLFTEASGQNTIEGNNFRASNRPWSLTADDLKAASHNILSGAIESNTHQGFTAGGPIAMGSQSLSFAGGKIIGVTDAPSPATGADGDVAFNAGARVGTSLFYKKVAGTWKPATPALT